MTCLLAARAGNEKSEDWARFLRPGMLVNKKHICLQSYLWNLQVIEGETDKYQQGYCSNDRVIVGWVCSGMDQHALILFFFTEHFSSPVFYHHKPPTNDSIGNLSLVIVSLIHLILDSQRPECRWHRQGSFLSRPISLIQIILRGKRRKIWGQYWQSGFL